MIRLKAPQLNYNLAKLRGDVFGGLTAAVVALPLSLAFGVASGLGAIAGLYGAIAVGFIAAVLGGTNTQISGPTAPLSVAMSVVVASYADTLAEAFTIAMLAGVIQILMGSLRLGSYVAYTPYSVISGFMSGVGAVIILVQTLPFLGTEVALGGPLESVRSWPDALADTNFSALTLGVLTLLVCVAWPTRLKKFLPPTVAALIIGTLTGALWLTGAPVIGEVPGGLPEVELPELSASALAGALQPAVTIALIASINSLLTAMAADSITRDRHNPDRELVGVGIGNVVAGLIGAVPGAGATSGTVANVRAGGRTRLSPVLCATVLLALVLGLGSYVDSVPHAVLAGILIKVGVDIIDWRFIRRVHRVQREHLVVMVVTLGLSIVSDLVVAVAVGLIIAALASSRQFERMQLDNVVSVPLLDHHFLHGGTSSDDNVDSGRDIGLASSDIDSVSDIGLASSDIDSVSDIGLASSGIDPGPDLNLASSGIDPGPDLNLANSDINEGGLDSLDALDALGDLDSFGGLDSLDSLDDLDGLDIFSARVGMVALKGSFTVASSRKLIHTVSMDIRDHELVILDFTETIYVDDSAALVVEQMIDTAIADGIGCIVMGLSEGSANSLEALDVLRRVPDDQIVVTLDEARAVAVRLLGITRP